MIKHVKENKNYKN